MPIWKVIVYREWKEYGYLEVDAATKEEAREAARNALYDDDDSITWQPDHTEPGEQGVDSMTDK